MGVSNANNLSGLRMQNVLNKSFFRASLDIAGLNFLASLFILIASFANNILIIIMLYKIFNYKKLNISFTVEILLILMGARFLLSYLQLLMEKSIKRKFCNQLTNYFKYSNWVLNKKSLISTLISRDILLLLDTIPSIPKLFYFPICFAMGIIVIYELIGLTGVIAISTVIFFVPLSLFIARKSIRLAIEIYDISKLRLAEMSKWIEWRSIIYNWAESHGLMARLTTITEKELHARTLDSVWRSFDLYIITFGRCLPVAILILISMIFKNDISDQLLLTIWLSVPFIALIMEAGRFTSDFQLGKKAFAELQKASQPQLKSINTEVVLDDNWEIWDGTLLENCLIDKDNIHLELVKKLRLEEELAITDKDINLSRFGHNISEGQKTRILLIRAIHIAFNKNLPLRIERTLNSLDANASRMLAGILEEPFIIDKITLSPLCKDFLEHQLMKSNSIQEIKNKPIAANNNDAPQKATQIAPIKNLLKDIFKFFKPLSLAFILPAISLSFVGYIAIANVTLKVKLIIIVLASVSSVILVVYLGTKNESHTRRWAKTRIIDILLNARLTNTTDIFQRVSRDFNTVVERISWYIHDITWLISLLLVSAIATVASFGMLGIGIVGIFLLLSYGIWRFFEIRINKARVISVDTVNQMLIMGENLVCYGNLANYSYINKIRQTLIESNVNNLYQSNYNLISLKIIFSNLIMCVSGLFILATLICSTYSWISAGLLVFILTAILAVDASFGMLFQALSGFSAQRISIHRLADFEKEINPLASGLIIKKQGKFIFNGATNPNTGVGYRPVTFESGSSYSVLGTSGIGKTQFLKLIAGLYDDSKNQSRLGENIASVLYIDKDSHKIASWIENELSSSENWTKDHLNRFMKDKILSGKFKVIVLDEALIGFSITTANEIINLIQGYISQIGGLLLFVDHRFSLDKSISIAEVQSPVN